MSKPVVAIVGRPNVGKSTLFNALAGEKISIVKDTPGVTRDRIYADVSWLDKDFTLIDTGGIEPESKDIILSQMREQAQIAIDTSDVIIFITDVKQGLVDSDSKVADMLRRSGKPVILVVNKVDNFDKYMADTYEFYNLGIGDPVPISASSRLGLGDMLDKVIEHFPEHAGEEEEDSRPRVAIVGKPNVGKSSIINKLLGEQRVIVSDIAGTTRDAIDTEIVHNGKEYVFIDTAGLRRKNKIKEELERYSIIRTVTAVERADVVLVVIDATQGVTEQDAKVAGIAHERGKGVIIVVNKWDAIEKMMMDGIYKALQSICILIIVGILIGVWINAGRGTHHDLLRPADYPSLYLLHRHRAGLFHHLSGHRYLLGHHGHHGCGIHGHRLRPWHESRYAAGAILSGAYFGDKMSPLSDTTNLAPAMAGTDVIAHVKA